MTEPMVSIPLSAFNELRRALGIAISYRQERIREDTEGFLAPHIRESLHYDEKLWLDLLGELNKNLCGTKVG